MGIKLDPEKVFVIVDMREPTDGKDASRPSGIVSCLARFSLDETHPPSNIREKRGFRQNCSNLPLTAKNCLR